MKAPCTVGLDFLGLDYLPVDTEVAFSFSMGRKFKGMLSDGKSGGNWRTIPDFQFNRSVGLLGYTCKVNFNGKILCWMCGVVG